MTYTTDHLGFYVKTATDCWNESLFRKEDGARGVGRHIFSIPAESDRLQKPG